MMYLARNGRSFTKLNAVNARSGPRALQSSSFLFPHTRHRSESERDARRSAIHLRIERSRVETLVARFLE